MKRILTILLFAGIFFILRLFISTPSRKRLLGTYVLDQERICDTIWFPNNGQNSINNKQTGMFTVSIHEPMIDTIILFDGGYHEVSYGRDGWKYYDTTLCWMTDFPLFNRVYLFGLGCKPNLQVPDGKYSILGYNKENDIVRSFSLIKEEGEWYLVREDAEYRFIKVGDY